MEDKKYYLTLFIIALLTVAAVFGVYYWSTGVDSPDVVIQPDKVKDEFGSRTPLEQLQYIKKDQEITVLPITSEEEISKEALPPVLDFFILPQAEGIKISSVRYPDNKEGFKIEYLTPNSLQEAYKNLSPLQGSEWNFLFEGHTDKAGVRNVESINYNVSTEFIISETEMGKTSVISYVIKK
jgi:hypothetical protein